MAFDGTEQLTPFKDLLNSVVTAANARIQAGTGTVPITTQNVIASITVTFPVAYAVAPVVICNAATAFPERRFAQASSVTTTGFTVSGFNNASAATFGFSWVAVGV